MFTDSTHDFGSLARGSKAQYRFKFTNPYVESLHVSSVRSSCGCTAAEASKTDLKTWETGDIVANFNTNSFYGNHSATITVTFDKPYFAEVQLQVSGNILSDVVMQPGVVELGSVDAGQGAERKIMLTHTGRSDWAISDVQSANTNFEVEVNELKRAAGTVVYELLVRLKPTSPAGYINDQLFLVTNDDPEAQKLPVDVTGRVVAAVTVSPASLMLGALTPGQAITKNVVVRSKRPFKVLEVSGGDEITCTLPADSRDVQIIPLTFTAPQQPGVVKQKIKIKTDLGDNAVPDITCQATIVGDTTPPAAIPESANNSARRGSEATASGATSTGFHGN